MNRSPLYQRSLSIVLGGALAVGLGACIAPPPKRSALPRAEVQPVVAVAVAPTPRSTCADLVRSWNTRPDDGGLAMSPSVLYLVRAGAHPCYDRVVFDVNGPAATGFIARYVPVVGSDGQGAPVPVPGAADLEVVVRAPIVDDAGHQPWRRALRVGDAMIPAKKLAGLRTVTAVTYAGSFEGQTTIAIGLHSTRPFRVWEYGDKAFRHVVVDVAR